MLARGLFCFLLCIFKCKSDNEKFEIVAGDAINIEKVPFFAMYKAKKDIHGCGASIVTEKYLITAAQCNYIDDNIKNMEAVVGTDKINEGEHHDIAAVYEHPRFNFKHLDHDVLVIELKNQLTFCEKVQPIKLAKRGMVIDDGAVFQSMGFGTTNPNDHRSESDILLSVDMPYVNNNICYEEYSHQPHIKIKKVMICAGEKGRGVCWGDNGGPLVYNNTLVGVVSFGKGCAMRGFPAVFARISALRNFIDEVMKKICVDCINVPV